MTEASETKKEAQGEGSETGEARLATTYEKVSISPTQSKEREREKNLTEVGRRVGAVGAQGS
jgi:hypothetical protein